MPAFRFIYIVCLLSRSVYTLPALPAPSSRYLFYFLFFCLSALRYVFKNPRLSTTLSYSHMFAVLAVLLFACLFWYFILQSTCTSISFFGCLYPLVLFLLLFYVHMVSLLHFSCVHVYMM